ncbi:phage tail protein, partial [Moraxella catarrhalis]|nr:phage tail protein [Moraxella catarrhalis]
MKTFTWKMNMGASASVHHAVSKTQFGDGYAQRVSHGINNQRMDWSGSKTGDWQTVILPIKTFLDEHKGVIPFLWTNPHGQTKKYVCENYEISQKKGNFWEISLKFEQSNSDGSSVPLLDFSNQNSGTSTPNLPQSALDDINKKIQDEIERSTQKDDAHDKAIQSLNTSKTSLSKSIDEIKEQLAGVSSAPASVTWDSITGKPSSFNPSSHSHTISDISGLQSLLNAKANSNHSHAWNSITDKPQSFTPSSHVHQASDIADLHTILSKYATKDEIPQINTDGLTIDTSNLATKTSVETLANKVTEASEALKSETKLRANSIAAIDSKITTEVDRSSKKDTEHDDEIASLKRTKADLSHTHTMSEVTDLSAELERYALKTELNNI